MSTHPYTTNVNQPPHCYVRVHSLPYMVHRVDTRYISQDNALAHPYTTNVNQPPHCYVRVHSLPYMVHRVDTRYISQDNALAHPYTTNVNQPPHCYVRVHSPPYMAYRLHTKLPLARQCPRSPSHVHFHVREPATSAHSCTANNFTPCVHTF
jgi:hypothetical protein